jgi:hypothetical protein
LEDISGKPFLSPLAADSVAWNSGEVVAMSGFFGQALGGLLGGGGTAALPGLLT